MLSLNVSQIFAKAESLLKNNTKQQPVVLLDEVGLADVSRHNPLKVLHSKLEQSISSRQTGDSSRVAVVGISNWSLDAAKMNRAVHISLSDPSQEDLIKTATEFTKNVTMTDRNREVFKTFAGYVLVDVWFCFLMCIFSRRRILSKAYLKYTQATENANFHGNRDFYSMFRSIAGALGSNPRPEQVISQIITLMDRNFGGRVRVCERHVAMLKSSRT